MVFIQWCNNNNGFLTAILSIIGLLLSVIAIVVSIHTARLPYKKKLFLGSYLTLDTSIYTTGKVTSSYVGMSVSATNVGNRTISLIYLGYATKVNGKYKMIFPVSRGFDCKVSLEPSEMSEVQYFSGELMEVFSNEMKSTKLYVYAKDTEGKEYKRVSGTIEKLTDLLSK